METSSVDVGLTREVIARSGSPDLADAKKRFRKKRRVLKSLIVAITRQPGHATNCYVRRQDGKGDDHHDIP